jgi:hypothetical protein
MKVIWLENKTVVIYRAFVESETDKGKYYLVEGNENEIFCSCPAGKNKLKCKHIKVILGEINGAE